MSAFESRRRYSLAFRDKTSGNLCDRETATEFCFRVSMRSRISGLPTAWLPIRAYGDMVTVIDAITDDAFYQGQDDIQSALRTLLGIDKVVDHIDSRIESAINPYTG